MAALKVTGDQLIKEWEESSAKLAEAQEHFQKMDELSSATASRPARRSSTATSARSSFSRTHPRTSAGKGISCTGTSAATRAARPTGAAQNPSKRRSSARALPFFRRPVPPFGNGL